MKRKINKVGTGTLTVSLPSAWAKNAGIRAGDQLDVEEEGKKLIIHAGGDCAVRKITVDISSMGMMSGRIIGAIYKAGYDESEVRYDDPTTISVIQKELAKGFIGMDLLHQTRQSCTIKSMAALRPEEIDNSIKRMFALLKENADIIYGLCREGNWKELPTAAAMDANVNKYADFARRLLNKYGHPDYNTSNPIYYIVEYLENIGDGFRDIAKIAAERRIRFSRELLNLYRHVAEYLSEFFLLYTSFTPARLDAFGKRYKEICRILDKAYDSCSRKEMIIISTLHGMLRGIFELNGPLVTSRYLRC